MHLCGGGDDDDDDYGKLRGNLWSRFLGLRGVWDGARIGNAKEWEFFGIGDFHWRIGDLHSSGLSLIDGRSGRDLRPCLTYTDMYLQTLRFGQRELGQ